jgi:hypothetical protein
VSGHTVWLKTLNLALMGGTSVLEFKFGGNALSQTYFGQFLHLPGKIFPCYTHIGDNV